VGANPILQICFATEIQGLERRIIGSEDKSQAMVEKGRLLTSHNANSLAIDRLCDWAGLQDATVACFYFDFAAQKEQSPTSMPGALFKQLVYGLEETPEEVSRAHRGQRGAVGGRGPQISDIVKMTQTTSPKSAPTYVSTL